MAGMADIVYPVSSLSELKVTSPVKLNSSSVGVMNDITNSEKTVTKMSTSSDDSEADHISLSPPPKEMALEVNDEIKDPKVST